MEYGPDVWSDWWATNDVRVQEVCMLPSYFWRQAAYSYADSWSRHQNHTRFLPEVRQSAISSLRLLTTL